MTVLVDIVVRRKDGTGSSMRRIGVALEHVQEVADAAAVLVMSSEGGRVRRGEALRLQIMPDETVQPVASTDTVSDAPAAIVMPEATRSDAYPASHFDNPSVCGAQQPDMHGTSRCCSVRGHRGRHTWRKVLA